MMCFFKNFISVYWITRHEIPTCKLAPFLHLLERIDATEMK